MRAPPTVIISITRRSGRLGGSRAFDEIIAILARAADLAPNCLSSHMWIIISDAHFSHFRCQFTKLKTPPRPPHGVAMATSNQRGRPRVWREAPRGAGGAHMEQWKQQKKSAALIPPLAAAAIAIAIAAAPPPTPAGPGGPRPPLGDL